MNTKKTHTRGVKKRRAKSFIFFLLLAALFWVLTKFSNEYSTTLETNLKYINIPNDVTLIKDQPKSILLDVTGNGFSFLFFKFKKPVIEIDVSAYANKEELSLNISKNQWIKICTEQLNTKAKVNAILNNNLDIKLDNNTTKKVPVQIEGDFYFEKGFNKMGELKITPDSVTISGPSRHLDSLKFIKATFLRNEKIKKTISEALELQLQDYMVASTKEVQIDLQVNEFIQQQFQVPIEIINKDKKINIQILPQTVLVRFLVSMQDFKKVTIQDFKLVGNFLNRNNDSNTIPIKLVKSPADIIQVELEHQNVEYLVFK